MKVINVYPYHGIGDILFGMTRRQVEQIISCNSYCEDKILNDGYISVRYEDYHITYRDNEVVEICINEPLDNAYMVVFDGIDLFRTKAEEIFDTLKKLSEYDCDCYDEYLSSSYYFKAFNMALWRESAFHPKLLKEDWFLELISANEENLEYEQRFWFFQQVCLRDQSMPMDPPMEKSSFHIDEPKAGIEVSMPTPEELKELASKYGLLK